MADAKKCDVCGEFYSESPPKRYPTGIVHQNGRDSVSVCLEVVARQATESEAFRGAPVDLCPSCMDHALVDAARNGVRGPEPAGVPS